VTDKNRGRFPVSIMRVEGMEASNVKSGVFSSPSREKMARNGIAYKNGARHWPGKPPSAVIQGDTTKIKPENGETTEL
jgi:hypothetical protein